MEGIEESFAPLSPKSPFARRNGRSLRIQRLVDCQHFHYSSVELGPVRVAIIAINADENATERIKMRVESESNSWLVERSREDWAVFDRQLHRCVFERRHSRLDELFPLIHLETAKFEEVLVKYTERLSELTGSIITCYPVLKFLEIDSRGGHFEPAEETSINVPAIAAAVVTKDFEPTESSQLRLRVGDIVSITEMSTASPSEQTFWKAKLTISNQKIVDPQNARLGFEIGYFPRDCVMLIDDKRLPNPLNNEQKASTRNARRYMTTMFRNRRREPIFGLELTDLYMRTGKKVPVIVEKCCASIEDQGIVTGIYRQCGIQSNIQRLRAKFDSGAEPDLHEFGQRDIYSVSSLLKQYFRQLPNPLFTYQAYPKLIEAFEKEDSLSEKVESLRFSLETMPEAHYRTAKFLMEHLTRLCKSKSLTDMTSKNLAIVWSPNLFRPPPTLNGADTHLLSGLNVHTAICDFFIENSESLFVNDIDEEQSKCTSVENSFTTISKSATMSDMRSESESKWPRFFRGKSVEGFWKFNRKQQTSTGELCGSPTSEVKWRRSTRSHSTDAAFQSSRTDSFIQLMHTGMDQIREGMRIFRARARSMRPTSRPPPSPRTRRARFSNGSSNNVQKLNESDIQHEIPLATTEPSITPEPKNTVDPHQIMTRTISVNDSDDQSFEENGLREMRERKVMFKAATQEHVATFHERSSPVEEWSSDSRESLHLEMSRYDNVSPSGTITRNQREPITNLSPAAQMLFFESSRASHLFSA
ncbi:GTPase-activating protein rrc-1 [Caenorhabditis elegans]|uniref:GTPase-activating protein rrc-1 n=1 Tax=Caenorhabditis elegans TaxID=6239 RepID=C6KRH8_CAEEL|nr:GTPase-activating protein rrc-1 [Caenorhabditis elegans]CAZ65502.1 GTPase-activating protein rrc-1 [Caenorhabditis elegans]|eukprot:NP_001257090.1 GTPase-activating protein rrc-1 [Caenorhabditis elegans]